jgi:lipase
VAAPLHVHEFGPPDGVPLLALHGLTGHGARWRALATEQLSGYRVLAPDLRGHGRSTSLPPWTLEQHAADVLRVIDRYQLAAAPVLAHSFGGAIALQTQRLAPGRISKLVLLDPATGLPPSIALDHAGNPPRVFADRREAFQAQRHDWPTATDTTVERELAEHLEQVGEGWRFRYSGPAMITAWSEMARPAVLPQPGTPTLLVRALRARFVSDALVNGCRMALGKDFELADIDCGHMIYLERPHETGLLVTKFVGTG